MLEHTPLPLPIQGVSEKEDDLKNPLRVKSQLNMFSSETKGLTRRMPFEHVTALEAQTPSTLWYQSSRMLTKTLGTNELVIGKGVVGVRENSQDLLPITFDTTGAETYITDLMAIPTYGKIITIGDSFIVLNKTRIVTTTNDVMYRSIRGAIWVKNMEFGRTIKVYQGSTLLGSFTIANGEGENDYEELAPDFVLDAIQDILQANGLDFSNSSHGVAATFTHHDISIDDGKGGTLISYHNGEVKSSEDLPIWAQADSQVKINPSTKEGEDSSYYVYFNGDTWVESMKGEYSFTGTENYLVSENSMPMRVFKEDNEWHAAPMEWTMRRVGDIDSHPFPYFASGSKSITDIFTYKERLAIVSGESVEFSRVNDYTDFASLTARDSLDDDPIKLRATSSSSQSFRFSTVLDKYCILLTDFNIFILGSGVEAPFTPSTAQLNNIFTSSEKFLCDPEIHGESLLTCSGSTSGVQINQLFIDAYGSFVRNPCLTEHVPSYLGKKPYKILSSHSSKLFFVLTEDERNTIAVCQLSRNTEGAIDQLAWHKWEVGHIAEELQDVHAQEIVTTNIYNNYLYISFIVNNTWTSSRIPLRLDNIDLEDVIYLDHQQYLFVEDDFDDLASLSDTCGGSGVAVLSYKDYNDATRQGYILDQRRDADIVFDDDGRVDYIIYPLANSANRGDGAIVGIPYESSITTGRVFPRDKQGSILHSIKMQLRWFDVSMMHSGFNYTVTPDARPVRTQYKQPRRVSRYTRPIQQRQYFKGIERVLVGADSRAIDFEFSSHDHHPLVITSLEAAHYSTKRGS